MADIEENLARVRSQLLQSTKDCRRELESVALLAVSKTKPVEDIRRAFAAGQRDFGENYLQEALEKIHLLRELEIVWHYIGAIQSNKAKLIAENFSWIHTLDRLKVAQRLSQFRPSECPPLQVCLQVNIDNEPTKAGCAPESALELARQVSALPGMCLRGLMVIPRPNSGAEPYRALFELLALINRECDLHLDTLSMGMSQDMGLAITEGATIVRVGTAIFGERENK